MKVTAILKGKKDSLGRQAVYIRINDGHNRSFKATRVKVTGDQFKDGIVTDHPQAKILNQQIRKALLDSESAAIHNIVTAKYPDADFRTYCGRLQRIWDAEKSLATLSIYKRESERFLNWYGETQMSKVTAATLEDYKAHLQAKGKDGKPMDVNSVWKAFKTLRTIFTHAYQHRVIEDNPFTIFKKPAYKEKKKDYLVEEDLLAIDNYVQKEDCPKTFKHLGNWFLIGCYSGIRYSDMQQFDARLHIKDGRLSMETIKTGDIVGMPLKGKLLELFERISYKPLNLSNQKFNLFLKQVGEMASVETPLTVHLARHTFAMRCANAGVSPEVTARLMAVKSLKTVATYYKVVNKRIDQELDKLL